MKLKLTSIIVISLFITNISQAQYNPNQGEKIKKDEVSNFHIGAGLSYGDGAEAAGLQIGMLYRISKKISLAGDLSFFFPEYYSLTEVNINAHYNFVTSDAVFVYALAGLNNTSISFDFQNGDYSDSKTGINVGVGSQFRLGVIDLYTELKTVLNSNENEVIDVSSSNKYSLTAGLRYGF